MSLVSAVALRSTKQVAAGSAALFRICFGAVGLLLVVRFFAHGWIDSLFVEPVFHFTYPGLGWVRPWPGLWMHLHFGVVGLAALGVALGYRYRLSAALFTLSFAYLELIDRTLYLNHYYWVALTGALMVFLPLNRALSVDSRRGRVSTPGSVPVWVVWLLRFQVGMVYFFAGLAKVNGDWLLRAEPLATWLPARSELWLLGPVLALPATAYVLSWAGAFFDLTIVGWLLNKHTRFPAYLALVAFHTTTWLLFPSIGVFPLLMSLSALVFFEPDWPFQLWGRRRRAPTGSSSRLAPGWVVVAAAYVLVMATLPLRHYAAPGDVKWTGEGYLGSWQVMLSEKSGSGEFIVHSDDGSSWQVPPPSYLTERQRKLLATDPTLIRQTARLVSADNDGAAVSADVKLSFNGRPSRQFTDPSVILTGSSPSDLFDWILPEPGT